MVRYFINGCSHPTFTIKELNGSIVEIINLDFTDETGLIEDIKPEYITHKLLNRNICQKQIGFHIHFVLPYESGSRKPNSLNIKKVLDYIFTNNFIVELTPRSDFKRNTWEVELENESIKQGILKGGEGSKGNRLINLQLQTKYLQNGKIPWYDLDAVVYHGTFKYPYVGVLKIA